MAAVGLTGVVEMAGARDTGVPVNPRTTLRYTRGSTLDVALRVVGSDGAPIDLTGATLELTVKRTPSSDERILVLAGTVVFAPLSGCAVFSIPATAFSYTDPGRYVYDIWLARGTLRDAVMPVSPFVLESSLRSLP
jgi:hypothetical protein